ncbi:EamA family transporter RarD [Pseudarthrobacter sp. P1]|uniref:EamA family transporter RarD n=1 Tax=Pseudarthrobacter sp. P1 TaxID=3418418 RepID=UPI003CF6D369
MFRVSTSEKALATTSLKPAKGPRSESSTGVLYGIGAYGIWGLLPIYFALLIPATAVEIVANRVVFSLVFCALLLTATRGWRKFADAVRDPKVLGVLALAAVLIAINWLTYTYGITTGHAIEASLGYFINPLVSVLLGVLVLKEKLRPLQWAAMATGFTAVVVLTIGYGQLPWIALVLAFSFGLYGFVKKKVGSKVDATSSLSIETAVLAPFAAVTMVAMGATGVATLGAEGPGHFWLMVSSGVITAVPLVWFGASASRLPMTTLGLLQYFAPVLQFIIAITILGEHMGFEQWVGFFIVWLALALLTLDMLRGFRRTVLLRRAAVPA